MKKLIISGSSKLQERAAYWRGYFEGRGYEVIDYPGPVSASEDESENLTDVYTSFYQNIDRSDVFFLMNEDNNNIGGYIGPSAFAELSYALIANLNRGKKIEINLLQTPSVEQACYEEISFWLNQGWIHIYDRPTGKKAAIPVPETPAEPIENEESEEIEIDEDDIAAELENEPSVAAAPAAVPHSKFFSNSAEKTINIRTAKKRCLRSLSPAAREYLYTLSPEFPAWLLKYLSAPEMQRLSNVSMACGLDHSGLYNFSCFHSVFQHSIGVALIVWRFTRDKKQTLAALFHDIASPAFKHCIDLMNGDAEIQESTEEKTSQIIRNSRAIMRQLKKDGILAGEVSDYHLFPIADNDVPGLAADRLEYTLSNGYFLYDTWTLEDVKRFSDDLTILKNENDIDEIGFKTASICKEFVKRSLPEFAIYHSDEFRAIGKFTADIIKSMDIKGYLTSDDLYIMSEREIIDWILSCGDKTLSEAFRNFQRATTIYAGGVSKKDRYCISFPNFKIRYTVPLVAGEDEAPAERITERSLEVRRAVEKYLDQKTSKYVGFDFEFTPYTE